MQEKFEDEGSKSNGSDLQVSKAQVSLPVTKMNKPVRANTSFHYFGYVVIIIGGTACGCMFLTRFSITVAMLNMVNHTALYEYEHPESDVQDFFEPDYVERGEFMWTNEIQQMIISSYMVTYTIPQFFTTRLANRIGLHLATPISLLICGLSCLLTPISAYYGWVSVLLLRLLNGIGGSAILSTMIDVVERWMPYEKSARGLALLQFISMQLYTVAPLISGYLVTIHWKWAFYFPALVALIVSVIWWLLASDSPDESRYISETELARIKGGKPGEGQQEREARPLLPWYFMFKIKSFYALTITWMLYCSTSGGAIFILPTYFNKVMKLTVDQNGLYIFIINFGCMFSMLWSNPTTEYLQRRFGFTLTSARRLIFFISQLATVITFVYLALTHSNQVLILSINRFFLMNYDTVSTATLMSKYGKEGLSSQVYSMMNTFGCFTMVILCWAVGRFLDYTGESLECWTWIFLIMALLNAIAFIIYALFITSEPVSCYDSNIKSGVKQPA